MRFVIHRVKKVAVVTAAALVFLFLSIVFPAVLQAQFPSKEDFDDWVEDLRRQCKDEPAESFFSLSGGCMDLALLTYYFYLLPFITNGERISAAPPAPAEVWAENFAFIVSRPPPSQEELEQYIKYYLPPSVILPDGRVRPVDDPEAIRQMLEMISYLALTNADLLPQAPTLTEAIEDLYNTDDKRVFPFIVYTGIVHFDYPPECSREDKEIGHAFVFTYYLTPDNQAVPYVIDAYPLRWGDTPFGHTIFPVEVTGGEEPISWRVKIVCDGKEVWVKATFRRGVAFHPKSFTPPAPNKPAPLISPLLPSLPSRPAGRGSIAARPQPEWGGWVEGYISTDKGNLLLIRCGTAGGIRVKKEIFFSEFKKCFHAPLPLYAPVTLRVVKKSELPPRFISPPYHFSHWEGENCPANKSTDRTIVVKPTRQNPAPECVAVFERTRPPPPPPPSPPPPSYR